MRSIIGSILAIIFCGGLGATAAWWLVTGLPDLWGE